MKQAYNQSSHRNNLWKWLLAIFLLAVAIFTAWYSWQYYEQKNQADPGPTPEQQKAAEKANDTKKDTFIEKKDDTQTTPLPSNNSIELTAKEESSGTVIIYTKITNIASGTCTLQIKNGANEFTKSAPVIYQDSYSSCAGFTVPVDQLRTGTWDIVLTVTPASGTPISKTITYTVQ